MHIEKPIYKGYKITNSVLATYWWNNSNNTHSLKLINKLYKITNGIYRQHLNKIPEIIHTEKLSYKWYKILSCNAHSKSLSTIDKKKRTNILLATYR